MREYPLIATLTALLAMRADVLRPRLVLLQSIE